MTTNRGRPLRWKLREEIKRRIGNGQSRRQIAIELRLARETVKKYAKQV
jgi:DNA-binding CsgD family transcriptional regulator